eukprot:TRINITY_DN17713_c0_g1_i1.p1 TRINITY_DN17713_c0_g1~~TRINITY_DN17713_c0_g1_i1.p1  ORF type:complete len:321 (+),score=76.48 TRINITY_DN17713_c0_g1_i1:74-964(+)
MPPKAAAVPVLPQRPQTPNDVAIQKTESALHGIESKGDKWKLREHQSMGEGIKTFHQKATIEIGLQVCEKLLAGLDAKVENILHQRLEPQAEKDEKGKKKPQGTDSAVTPQPVFKKNEIRDVTQLLMSFYMFDNGASFRSTGSPPKLVGDLKQEVWNAIEAAKEQGDATAKKIRSKAVFNQVAVVDFQIPHDDSAIAHMSVLPAPRGFDRAIWEEMIQYRGKRIHLKWVMHCLKNEVIPIVTRDKGLVSMYGVTQYALKAVSREKAQLLNILKEQERVRHEESTAWGDGQKAKAGK